MVNQGPLSLKCRCILLCNIKFKILCALCNFESGAAVQAQQDLQGIWKLDYIGNVRCLVKRLTEIVWFLSSRSLMNVLQLVVSDGGGGMCVEFG